jgi:hypothetical protein
MLTIEQIISYKKIIDIKQMITKKQYEQLEKVAEYYNVKTIKNRLTNIREFILNNVEDHWLGRIRIITNKLKNDVISEYACKIRYGNNWELKQNNLKTKVRMDKDNFIKKYGEEEGTLRWQERNLKVKSYGLKYAIARYGKEEGKKRWEKTLNQKIQTMSERKKIRPYRNGRTLAEYQERYGVTHGYKLWDERNKRQSYRNSIQGFIDKYGEIDGKLKWEEYRKSMALTTLESFVKRYGETLGKERYDSFIQKIKYSATIDYYIEKYGEIDGLTKYKENKLSKIYQFQNKYSKISQDLFWSIYPKLTTNEGCYFYELNTEYTFYVWEDNMTIINVDFKLGNKIIEFDGDYWHSKPEQIKKDKQRDDYLRKKGYIILRIRESDYRNDKNKIINECLNFLKND